jgi:hypothetical protein
MMWINTRSGMPDFCYASPALRKFLVARAQGADPKLLSELMARSLVEQDHGRRLRLVVSNDGSDESKEASSSPADAADNENPDLAG